MSKEQNDRIRKSLYLLGEHYNAFFSVVDIARETGHPVPMDTRGWSQIIVSVLTGIKGLERKKGADLDDGSDVKGANTWEAIDTPRFNGVIKAGTQASHSDSLDYLDTMPYLFFVLWDLTKLQKCRCRIWVVRPQTDHEFRNMCEGWYKARAEGKIKSANFQLHPPRGKDSNDIRNTFGNLTYPLLFEAVRDDIKFETVICDSNAMLNGVCMKTHTGLL
jgi:hypothetical protein